MSAQAGQRRSFLAALLAAGLPAPAAVRAYVARYGYTFPAAMADTEVVRTFGAHPAPPP